MTINIPCWTTSKEEADKLVDELSEGCYEYGKDESKEKMLDVFYKTKMLKNYVGIMQGRIELLTARIAELEAAQRWIPVSERLPELDQDVLAVVDDDIVIGSFGQGWDGEISFDRDEVGSTRYVTHWMPLPEPPEVQE